MWISTSQFDTCPEGFQLTVWDWRFQQRINCLEAILGETLLEELLKKAVVGGVVQQGKGD